MHPIVGFVGGLVLGVYVTWRGMIDRQEEEIESNYMFWKGLGRQEMRRELALNERAREKVIQRSRL
jgi:hypothetical protein